VREADALPTVQQPSTNLRAVALMTIEPGAARVCKRAARLVEWPIGVYSVCVSSVCSVRTTTSPVFTPTRIQIGACPRSRRVSEYRLRSSCIRSAA
jgi:hypothetical protein